MIREPELRSSGYAGDAWTRGPQRIYDSLAAAMIAGCAFSLRGARVLDLGAGTGAASRAIGNAGGHTVGLDLEQAMLRAHRDSLGPAVAGDACALPFRNAAFDATTAFFVLSHVPDPSRILREMARVTRSGGPVLCSTFAATSDHRSKRLVESVLVRHGYERPHWYAVLKSTVEPLLSDPQRFAALAHAAGLQEVTVTTTNIDVGVLTARELVAWRLGLAHAAPFLAALDDEARHQIESEALEALGPDVEERVQFPVVLLTCRVAEAGVLHR